MGLFSHDDEHNEKEHKILLALREHLKENKSLDPKDAAEIDGVSKELGYEGGHQQMLEYARVANQLEDIVWLDKAGDFDAELFGLIWKGVEFTADITGYKADCEYDDATEYYINFTLQGNLIINGKKYHFILGKNDEDRYINGAQTFDDAHGLFDEISYANYRRGILAAFKVDEEEGAEASESEAVVCALLDLLMKKEKYLINKFVTLLLNETEKAADEAKAGWDSYDDDW